MKTRIPNFFMLVLMAFFFSTACLLAQNKYEKQYQLQYHAHQNESFVLDNNFYYIRYLQADTGKVKHVFSSGSMKMKYDAVKQTDEGVLFRVEYLEKHRESLFRGQLNTDSFAGILGKHVQYTLSHTGVVSGFSNVDIEKSEENEPLLRHLEEEIIHMLPTLPDHPVKIGDQWQASFGGDGQGFESFSLEYTLLDEVVYNGYDCVKIIARYQTNNVSSGTSNGKKYEVDSQSTGQDLYYFAYKEGCLLSRKSIGNGTTKVYIVDDDVTQNRTSDVLYETNITL